MQAISLKSPINFLLAFLLILVVLPSFKNGDAIVLKDEAIPFKPAGFYIAGIDDKRDEKKAMAQLVIKTKDNRSATRGADMDGGVQAAVSGFIERNLAKNESARPVIVGIKELKLSETGLNDGRVDGQIILHLSFGLKKAYGAEHLVNYKSSLRYTRPGSNTEVIEPQLRRILTNGLIYFNNWMKVNEAANPQLAKNVRISFKDHTEQPEGDTIYYSAKRPLTWADFQSKFSPSGPFAAQVMPGIGYDQEVRTNNGTIHVTIAMRTYLPKSECWVESSARENYVLNHEQRHFDIVKIITEQYKRKVLAESLTVDTYQAFISMQYLDSFRDMNAMQKTYDTETRHGKDRIAQAEWNERIDSELAAGRPL